MDDQQTSHRGPIKPLKQVAATLLATLHNRLELLVVELQEERIHVLNALMLTAVIVAVGVFTLAMAASALSIVVWKQFGLGGLWVLSALGLLGTLLAYWRLRMRLRHWPLLPETLAQLKRDRESWAKP